MLSESDNKSHKLSSVITIIKPVLYFLLKFFVIYISLTFLYNNYLDSTNKASKPDIFTIFSSKNTEFALRICGFKTETYPESNANFMRFYLDDKYILRVVEGCNGVSLVILFFSLIITFGQNILYALMFSFFGIIIIHIANIIRLSILIYFYRYLPDYANFFHDVIFPIIIYGVLLVLWIVFLKYFAFKPKADENIK